MRKIGEETRVKANVYVDESLRDFLLELKNEMNLSISQLVEQATIVQFEKDYEEFIVNKYD